MITVVNNNAFQRGIVGSFLLMCIGGMLIAAFGFVYLVGPSEVHRLAVSQFAQPIKGVLPVEESATSMVVTKKKPTLAQTVTPPITVIPEGWDLYTSEKYGFSFAHPSKSIVTELSNRNMNGVLFGVSVAGVNIFVEKKSALNFRGVACDGMDYDSISNMWLGISLGCNDDIYYKIVCEFDAVGTEKYPALSTGTGDAGVSVSVRYLVTNREYAIVVRVAHDEGTSSESAALQEQILSTLKILEGVEILKPECKPVSESGILPAISLLNGKTIQMTDPISISFSALLPKDMGVYLQLGPLVDNSYVVKLGDVTTGKVFTSKSVSELVEKRSLGRVNKNAEVEAFFYKKIQGRKVLLPDHDGQKIPVSIENNLPSAHTLEINPAGTQGYQWREGKLILKRDSWNQDTITAVEENLVSCERYINGELSDGMPEKLTFFGSTGIYLKPGFPSGAPIHVVSTCTTPKGSLITRELDFYSE